MTVTHFEQQFVRPRGIFSTGTARGGAPVRCTVRAKFVVVDFSNPDRVIFMSHQLMENATTLKLNNTLNNVIGILFLLSFVVLIIQLLANYMFVCILIAKISKHLACNWC